MSNIATFMTPHTLYFTKILPPSLPTSQEFGEGSFVMLGPRTERREG
jgi:hypothetical protein